MAKTFKNIPSLHRLLESAPLESVRDLLLKIDEQGYAACFDDVVATDEAGDEGGTRLVEHFARAAHLLDPAAVHQHHTAKGQRQCKDRRVVVTAA